MIYMYCIYVIMCVYIYIYIYIYIHIHVNIHEYVCIHTFIDGSVSQIPYCRLQSKFCSTQKGNIALIAYIYQNPLLQEAAKVLQYLIGNKIAEAYIEYEA